MPARSRDALCQEFMMKHEYESLKEEDKAWGKKVNFIAGKEVNFIASNRRVHCYQFENRVSE